MSQCTSSTTIIKKDKAFKRKVSIPNSCVHRAKEKEDLTKRNGKEHDNTDSLESIAVIRMRD
jgi:hypothetical protein